MNFDESDDLIDESMKSDSDNEDREVDYDIIFSNNDNDHDNDNELNIDDMSGDEDDDEGILPENNHVKFTITSNHEVYHSCKKNKKKLRPYLSKFEIVKIISLRAQQIENNSPVLVDVPLNMTSSRDIAELEFKEKKIPFIIRRYSNNYSEDWRLDEFINY